MSKISEISQNQWGRKKWRKENGKEKEKENGKEKKENIEERK